MQTVEAALNLCCGNLVALQSQFQEAGMDTATVASAMSCLTLTNKCTCLNPTTSPTSLLHGATLVLRVSPADVLLTGCARLAFRLFYFI